MYSKAVEKQKIQDGMSSFDASGWMVNRFSRNNLHILASKFVRTKHIASYHFALHKYPLFVARPNVLLKFAKTESNLRAIKN